VIRGIEHEEDVAGMGAAHHERTVVITDLSPPC
jgi:hypothetical protein